MTDDIITRLRSEWPDVKDAREAADALEAKDRQIEALELELKVRLPIQEYKAHLKSRIAELEAALKPFDEMLQRDFSFMADDKRYADDFTSTVLMRLGDLRAARAALGEKE